MITWPDSGLNTAANPPGARSPIHFPPRRPEQERQGWISPRYSSRSYDLRGGGPRNGPIPPAKSRPGPAVHWLAPGLGPCAEQSAVSPGPVLRGTHLTRGFSGPRPFFFTKACPCCSVRKRESTEWGFGNKDVFTWKPIPLVGLASTTSREKHRCPFLRSYPLRPLLVQTHRFLPLGKGLDRWTPSARMTRRIHTYSRGRCEAYFGLKGFPLIRQASASCFDLLLGVGQK